MQQSVRGWWSWVFGEWSSWHERSSSRLGVRLTGTSGERVRHADTTVTIHVAVCRGDPLRSASSFPWISSASAACPSWDVKVCHWTSLWACSQNAALRLLQAASRALMLYYLFISSGTSPNRLPIQPLSNRTSGFAACLLQFVWWLQMDGAPVYHEDAQRSFIATSRISRPGLFVASCASCFCLWWLWWTARYSFLKLHITSILF